jgi:VCBS repeat-containing protein
MSSFFRSNRRLNHRSFVRRALGLEQLQQRAMLAGNVSAFVDRGTLIVTGDIGDNELRITNVGNNMVQLASMSSPTTINNLQSVATFHVTKGMIFNMGGGNDVLQFDGITMKQKNDLVVDMGRGDDNLQFNNMNVLRIRAVLGDGHDSATVTNSRVERSLNIFGAGGDDQITLANSRFGEKSVMDGNGGANFLNQSNVKFGRKLQSLNLTFGTRPEIVRTPIAAVTDAVTVDEAVSNFIIRPLTNDTPTQGATISPSTLDITDGPNNGTANVNPDGTISYTHDGSETTSDTIKYTISDSAGKTATGTINITVRPINDAPVADNDTGTVGVGGSKTFDVSLNDEDSDNAINKASIVIVTPPTVGTATTTSDGKITYTHAGTTTTTQTIVYTIKDASGATSNNATLTITIDGSNGAPDAVDDATTVTEGQTNVTIDVLANDTDPQGASTIDASTLEIVSQPANGTASVVNGKIVYTHNGSNTLSDTITYRVRDALGVLSDVATVAITVTPVNDPPVAVADNLTAVRGQSNTLNLALNDTDSEDDLDLESIVIVANPTHGTITVNVDGTVTYVNNGNAATTDSFSYNIKDGSGTVSNTVTVSLTISAQNQAPVAENDSQTVAEGAAATITVLSNDEDPDVGGSLNVTTVEIVTGPANGTAVPQANGTVVYTHNGSETLSDTFTYRVKDNLGLVSNTATVTITVTPVNDAPVAVADAINVAPGGTVEIPLSSNDTDADNALDLESIVVVVQPTNGSFEINDNGTVTYTHNGGSSTTDSFTYNIKDVSGATSNTVTVTITIAEPNDPPTAADDSATVDEGATFSIPVSSNDSDTDGALDLESIVIVSQPTNGSVVVNDDGTISYTHNGSETLTDTFTYTIKDNDGDVSNTATVSITVTPINDAPTAVADAATLDEGDDVIIDVSDNDSDPDGTLDLDSIEFVDLPTNGSVIANGDGTVTYTHNGSETTTDSFTYAIKDNTGLTSATATVTITINSVNDPPSANDDEAEVDENESIVIPVASNDSDPEGALDLDSIAIVAQPANGSLTINGDGAITYLHDGSETIADSFTYTISDATGAVSSIATVTITITLVNDAPIAAADAANVDEGDDVTIDVAANDSDEEGTIDLTSIEFVDLPVNGSVIANGDGTVTYTHNGSETTSDSFTYTIKDNSGAVSGTATVTITVNPVNEAPFASGDVADVDEDASVVIPLSTNDVDPEGELDLDSIAIVSNPLHGSLTINGDGTVTYLHDGSETISDSFTYTISDLDGLTSNTVTVTITIAPVNDAPIATGESTSVTEDSGINAAGNVLANDTDAEGSLLSVSAVDGVLANVGVDVEGQFGTFRINADGTFTYELDDSNSTVNDLDDLEEILDSILYTISDGDLTATATLSVTIVGNTDP